MSNSIDELKPCPFCGYQPEKDNPDFCYPMTRPDADGARVWRAGCIENAGGCGAECTGWSAEEAIAVWNNRVGDDVIELIIINPIEKLISQLKELESENATFRKLNMPIETAVRFHEIDYNERMWFVGVEDDVHEYLHKSGSIKTGTADYAGFGPLPEKREPALLWIEKTFTGYFDSENDALQAMIKYYEGCKK